MERETRLAALNTASDSGLGWMIRIALAVLIGAIFLHVLAGCGGGGGDGKSQADIAATYNVTAAGDKNPPAFGGTTSIATSGSTSLTLTWTAANDDYTPQNLIAYEICQATSSTGCDTFAATYTPPAGTTSMQIDNLSMGTTYYFSIRAKDAAGNYTGALTVNGQLTTTATTTTSVVPSFGGSITVSNVAATSLALSWNASTDPKYLQSTIVYEICQSTSSTGCNTFSPTYTTSPGIVSRDIVGLTTGVTYYFAIRSKNGDGACSIPVTTSAVPAAVTTNTTTVTTTTTTSSPTTTIVTTTTTTGTPYKVTFVSTGTGVTDYGNGKVAVTGATSSFHVGEKVYLVAQLDNVIAPTVTFKMRFLSGDGTLRWETVSAAYPAAVTANGIGDYHYADALAVGTFKYQVLINDVIASDGSYVVAP